MNPNRFKALIGRRPQKRRPFTVAPKAAAPLPIEALDAYWHPDRPGVIHAPADFLAKLHAISEILMVCIPPPQAPLVYERAWLVWMKQPRVTHRLCPGWWMLFDWRHHFDDGKRKPKAVETLDDRVLANLYRMMPRRFGGAVKYFDHCVAEMQREKAYKDKKNTDDSHDRQNDYHDSTKITTAGTGSKFARHHDGTILPSRGADNWHRERRRHLIPKDVRLDEERQRDEAADARRGHRL